MSLFINHSIKSLVESRDLISNTVKNIKNVLKTPKLIKTSLEKNTIKSNVDDLFKGDFNIKFEFNEDVANVFDDMLTRSIPFYNEIIDLCIYFIKSNLKEENLIYDFGCSTGNFLIKLALELDNLNSKIEFIGIDSSFAMIEKAKNKFNSIRSNVITNFINDDFSKIDLKLNNFSIAHYTIQFIRPMERMSVVKKIASSINEGGFFLMSEKTISSNPILEPQIIKHYYDYKKSKGYNSDEITKKREALENILVPFSINENIKMLTNVGFKHVDILFSWLNFTLFVAQK